MLEEEEEERGMGLSGDLAFFPQTKSQLRINNEELRLSTSACV